MMYLCQTKQEKKDDQGKVDHCRNLIDRNKNLILLDFKFGNKKKKTFLKIITNVEALNNQKLLFIEV